MPTSGDDRDGAANKILFDWTDTIASSSLRTGLTLQCVGFLVFSITEHFFQFENTMLREMEASQFPITVPPLEPPANVVGMKTMAVVAALCYLLMLFGAFFLFCFGSFVQTPASVGVWASRYVYKGAAVVLTYAAILDVFVRGCSLAFWILASNGTNQPNSLYGAYLAGPFMLFLINRLLMACRMVAFLLYGISFFLLEHFHEDETCPAVAWVIGGLYWSASVLIFVWIACSSTLTGGGVAAFSVLLQLSSFGAMLSACLWAFWFERWAYDFPESGDELNHGLCADEGDGCAPCEREQTEMATMVRYAAVPGGGPQYGVVPTSGGP
mmetsp:Transcript_56121/g.109864  ORF Transcript_56121/g.109864 Transcript_56121/m.109864 type:complete len:326 (+) Transcript_56121:358-1335(+)